MTKENIIILPNKNLRLKSKKITVINQKILDIIEMMKAATIDWDSSREHEVGVALAAIQIDQPYKIIIIRNDFNKKEDKTFSIFINPIITKFEGNQIEDYEGCLSVPEIYGKVSRYDKVYVSAIDQNAKPIKITAEGFLARIFQHEIDHTKGKLFIDHIKSNQKAFFKLISNGDLEPLNYEENIKNNPILW